MRKTQQLILILLTDEMLNLIKKFLYKSNIKHINIII